MTFPTDLTPYRECAMEAAGGDVDKAFDIALANWAAFQHLAGNGYGRIPPQREIRPAKQQTEPVE